MMMGDIINAIPFRRINAVNPEVKKLEDSLEQTVDKINKQPFIFGVLIQNITIAATGNFQVKTGLKTAIKGWVAVDKTANIALYRVETTLEEQGILTLNANATGKISLWVF